VTEKREQAFGIGIDNEGQIKKDGLYGMQNTGLMIEDYIINSVLG
jgi:hypothetical protein